MLPLLDPGPFRALPVILIARHQKLHLDGDYEDNLYLHRSRWASMGLGGVVEVRPAHLGGSAEVAVANEHLGTRAQGLVRTQLEGLAVERHRRGGSARVVDGGCSEVKSNTDGYHLWVP